MVAMVTENGGVRLCCATGSHLSWGYSGCHAKARRYETGGGRVVLALLRIQWRISSYCGTAVADVFVILIRPRRFSRRMAPCTADLERPASSPSCWRLMATLRCSDL